MNVLIVNPASAPDSACQKQVASHFDGATAIGVRFATGILQATWQISDFSPDVIVFDRIGDCEQLGRLVAMLRRTNPAIAMYQLDDGNLVATENPCPASARLDVPHWLQELAAQWIFVQPTRAVAQCGVS